MGKCAWVGFHQIAFTDIFCIYIITVFTIRISILKALRNLVVEKPIYLLNPAFYNFFDLSILLSSVPIYIKYALEIESLTFVFLWFSFHFNSCIILYCVYILLNHVLICILKLLRYCHYWREVQHCSVNACRSSYVLNCYRCVRVRLLGQKS